MGEIRIYGYIGSWEDDISDKMLADQLEALGDVSEIHVRINSGGGSVVHGLGIFNRLRQHPARIIVHVDGVAASIASYIAMAGDEIHIASNAFIMVHNPWTVTVGNSNDHRASADQLDRWRDALIKGYSQRTGLSRDELVPMLDAETWLSAEDALAQGFATHIEDQDSLDAAAALPPEWLEAFSNVPARLRAMCTNPKRQETNVEDENQQPAPVAATSTPAPAAQAPAPQAATSTPAPARAPQADPARADASTILAACQRYGMDVAFASQLVNEGVTTAQMHERINDALLARQAPPSVNHVRTTVGQSGGEKLVEGVTNALLARAGLADHDGQNPYTGWTLRELARECLAAASVDVAGMDPHRLVGTAFTARASIAHTTSDFPSILANVAHKAMMRGYEEAGETFDQWCNIGSLTDFKPLSRVDLSTFPSLKQVKEGAEYTYATMGDRAELIQLATYGRMFSITRQAIINDDVSAFTRIPRAMGNAANRTVGDLVCAVLTSNPTMADGTALFHASRKNLSTGANSALSVDALDKARAAMRLQKDGDATLNISPSSLIVPATLEGTALTLMAAENKPGDADKVPNPVRNMAKVVVEARLDDASTTAWYLAASNSAFDTIEVAYLNGNRDPRLEQREGWTVDGVDFKCSIDAGVKAISAKTLHKATGA